MSAAYYIVLENEEVDFDVYVDGGAVADVADKLFVFCEFHGLATLDTFVGQDPSKLLAGFNLPGIFQINWFEAKQGLDYFLNLRRCLDANLCNFNKEPVIADINSYISVLIKADETGLKWHLAVEL